MQSERFDPTKFLLEWSEARCNPLHSSKTFARCICEAFGVTETDGYVYRAQAETTLNITQRAIDGKRAHGLHGWYSEEKNHLTLFRYPTKEEIEAYTELFNPSLNLLKALNEFRSSAKSKTIRSCVAARLQSCFYKSDTAILPAKKTREHINPYFSFWKYSCQELEWCGPVASSVHTKTSHHILPVLYHHFGCVVPSYASLFTIARLSQPAKPSKEPTLPILDIGSGNGYWTFMLRHFPISDISGAGVLEVRAIDNQLSQYRVNWIDDTIQQDGLAYLTEHSHGRGCVMLLVYPQATGSFTGPLLKKFEGNTVIVAGTQNENGFTGFQDCTVDTWVTRNLPDFELTLQMPLPSFAGKDDALFVFQRIGAKTIVG